MPADVKIPAMTTTSRDFSTRAPERARFTTEAARRRAVSSRDAGADGTFVFAVRTTGVYCRPSCASRAARRENVRFFDTCEAA